MAIEQFRKGMMQELLSRHAKFFAADKKEPRQFLQGIRYTENGAACVTNTHVLLRIKDVSPFDKPRTIHAVTGAELGSEYMSVDAINDLFKWDPLNTLTLTNEQIEAVTKYAKIAQQIEKELKAKTKIVKFALNKNNAFLQVSDQGVEFNVFMGELREYQDETWLFNADFLYNALCVFKGAGTKDLVIKLRHKNDVISLTDDENGIDVLLLPIRS